MDLAGELIGISLCSGGGGLDLGVELAIGPTRTACYVEREVFAISYLAEAMEEGWLAPAPVWTDLRTFHGRPWRGRVHLLTAGYPCQPFSLAGRRGGSEDPRHLWPRVRRTISQVQPGIVFLENVPGHVSLGFREVLGQLRRLGYRATAGLYSAAEVGASHKRERLFILGLADHDRFGQQPERSHAPEPIRADGKASSGSGRDRNHVADRLGPRLEGRPGQSRDPRQELTSAQRGRNPLVNAPIDGRGQGRSQYELRGGRDTAPDSGGGDAVGDAEREVRGGQSDSSIGGSVRGTAVDWTGPSLPVFPPGPQDFEAWESCLRTDFRIAPAQSKVRLLAHGVAADRARWLRLYGNGVCPLAAANAFLSLFAALREGELRPVQRDLFQS